MDLDKLLFILSCAKEWINRPVTEIYCTTNNIGVTMINGVTLYFSNNKVVSGER